MNNEKYPAGADVANIDTPEFRSLLTGVESARWGDCEPARQRLIAHVKAWGARIAAGASAGTPKPEYQAMGRCTLQEHCRCRDYEEDVREICANWQSLAAQPAPAPATDAREARRIGYWYPERGQAFISDTAPPGSEPIYAAMLSANSPREAG